MRIITKAGDMSPLNRKKQKLLFCLFYASLLFFFFAKAMILVETIISVMAQIDSPVVQLSVLVCNLLLRHSLQPMQASTRTVPLISV